jgi:pimeloyl-ACP methyl ester carboxylesterase
VLRRRRVALMLIFLGLPVALPLTGAAYEILSARRDSSRFAAPGRLISIGRGRLHLICAGSETPTVIFESSGVGNAVSFEKVLSLVSPTTRACAYDRRGMGWSDHVPGAISVDLLADDFQLLQNRADLRPPYLLVAASIGGLTAEMFARRHPELVAGIVFVDAMDSGALDHLAPILNALERQACLAGVAARFGVLRALDPFGLRQLAPATAGRSIALTYRVQTWRTVCALLNGIPTTADQFRTAPPIKADIPLVVLTHDRPAGMFPPGQEAEAEALDPTWRQLQQQLARRSARGAWQIVKDSDHLIVESQPSAVAETIVVLVAELRRGVQEHTTALP